MGGCGTDCFVLHIYINGSINKTTDYLDMLKRGADLYLWLSHNCGMFIEDNFFVNFLIKYKKRMKTFISSLLQQIFEKRDSKENKKS